MAEHASSERYVWCWTIEHHLVAVPGGALQVSWLRIPGFLGREKTEDCEAIFGADWETALLERWLPHDRWWLWWTESTSLRGLAQEAPAVRRARRLPKTLSPNEPAIWIGRGWLENFGAALLPPGAELHALIFKHGPSPYSEIDPNFILVLSPLTRGAASAPSPAELQRRVSRATPQAPGFDWLGGTADRLLMQWNGDLYLGVRARDEAALLAPVETWAAGYGVRVERVESS